MRKSALANIAMVLVVVVSLNISDFKVADTTMG
jgi:hypothetical protein